MATDRPQSVVFIDMDHTLLEGPFDSVVFPMILGEMSQKTGLDFKTLLQWVRQENLERQSNPAFSPVQAMDWDDIFAQLANSLGVKLQMSALEVVRTHPGQPHAVLHQDSLDVLEQLSAAKPRRALVLATKGLRKYQLPVLAALGLIPFFDDILTPDSNQALKHSIGFYGQWPLMTQIQIMVGDTYEDDVLPACQFGFKTVWRNRMVLEGAEDGDPFARANMKVESLARLPIRPDAIIFSLSELPHVVDWLEYEALSA